MKHKHIVYLILWLMNSVATTNGMGSQRNSHNGLHRSYRIPRVFPPIVRPVPTAQQLSGRPHDALRETPREIVNLYSRMSPIDSEDYGESQFEEMLLKEISELKWNLEQFNATLMCIVSHITQTKHAQKNILSHQQLMFSRLQQEHQDLKVAIQTIIAQQRSIKESLRSLLDDRERRTSLMSISGQSISLRPRSPSPGRSLGLFSTSLPTLG